MAGPIGTFIRTYPVTFWLTVGVFSYAWKASLVSTVYKQQYATWEQQRAKELADLNWKEIRSTMIAPQKYAFMIK